MQATVTHGFRLSPLQRRLWLLQDGAASVAGVVVGIDGQLDTSNLRRSVERLVTRHETLRMAFHLVPGIRVPVQVVGTGSPSWAFAELSHLDSREQDEAVERLIRENERNPFDLGRGESLRCVLCALSEHRHVLLISLPALCADGLSLKNVVEEISHFYAAGSGREDSLDEPLSYIQFSEWQNEPIEDEEGESGSEYWSRIDLVPFVVARLPFEGRVTGVRGEALPVRLSIGSDTTEKLRSLSRAYLTTSENLLAACWQTLLWKMLRQSSVGVGRLFHGRQYPELNSAIGLFAKCLPVECRFEEQTPFLDVVNQMEETWSEAAVHQEYFTWPRADMNSPLADSDQPYFAFGFEYVKVDARYRAGDLTFNIRDLASSVERFKIKLACADYGDSLSAALHFDPLLYHEEEVKRLAAQFERLVDSLIAMPKSSVGELAAVSDEDLRRSLVEFNDTVADYATDKCIHQLFEAQTQRTPDAVSVICGDEHLTYGALNRRSNQLAHHLRALGVGPESRTAIFMERSVDLLVSLLSVLKAGGAYVPLETESPSERLALMLRDAEPTVMLTHKALTARLPENTAQAVSLDADWEAIARQPGDNPGSAAQPGNIAYVIYTSGSTGQPKGVAIEHRQLLNYVFSIEARLQFPRGASFATVSTFAADLGNTMVFPSLVSGGSLHIISRECSSDAEALSDYFERRHVDCLKIVPSHLESLLSCRSSQAGNPIPLPRCRLILGGEATRTGWIEQIRALAPDCAVFNHYGPTETTVGVLTYQVNGEHQECEILPLGRPLANVRTYIVDSRLEPVGIWAPGELTISGHNVARGYLNSPERTAGQFMPDPFSAEPGARLYRSGDLARQTANGAIEFLGRVDDQVKFRGFRIELGEIRSALVQHPSVRDAVVILREDAPGNKRLVAYVLPDRKPAPSVAALRAFLRPKLSEYAIPSAFAMLATIPLTPNGKIDTRSLPSPEETPAEQSRPFVAPRTALEEVLAGIWSEILKVERVGVLDNFFELGGHSLLAMRVISYLRETFRIELPLRALFEETCVEQLAKAVISIEPKPGHAENVAEVLLRIKGMSAESVKETLASKKTGRSV